MARQIPRLIFAIVCCMISECPSPRRLTKEAGLKISNISLLGFLATFWSIGLAVDSEKAVVFASEAGKHTVFTSILPQVYFVERVGGNRVAVQALVTPGSSPATYEPAPRQMAVLSEATVFFRIGVPFENTFIPKIEETTKGLRIVDTRRGIVIRGNDPHIWLSPQLVKVQARTIADALIEIDPAGQATYERNLAAFLKDLDALDATITAVLAPVKGKTLMVFHPAWGYFADAYGLKQESVEVEGKDPSGRQLARIIEMAKGKGVCAVFVQPQFSMGPTNRISEVINGAVVPIDPLAKDYLGNLERVAAAVRDALEKQK